MSVREVGARLVLDIKDAEARIKQLEKELKEIEKVKLKFDANTQELERIKARLEEIKKEKEALERQKLAMKVDLDNLVIEDEFGFTVHHGMNRLVVTGSCCKMACVYIDVDELTN